MEFSGEVTIFLVLNFLNSVLCPLNEEPKSSVTGFCVLHPTRGNVFVIVIVVNAWINATNLVLNTVGETFDFITSHVEFAINGVRVLTHRQGVYPRSCGLPGL